MKKDFSEKMHAAPDMILTCTYMMEPGLTYVVSKLACFKVWRGNLAGPGLNHLSQPTLAYSAVRQQSLMFRLLQYVPQLWEEERLGSHLLEDPTIEGPNCFVFQVMFIIPVLWRKKCQYLCVNWLIDTLEESWEGGIIWKQSFQVGRVSVLFPKSYVLIFWWISMLWGKCKVGWGLLEW